MSEWYDFVTEDETGMPAGDALHSNRHAQAVQEKELQNAALAEQRSQMLNSLLERLYDRFPLLATRFKMDIERIDTLDLIRRLSITLALARNETIARRAILAATQTSLGECPNTDCKGFLLEEYA